MPVICPDARATEAWPASSPSFAGSHSSNAEVHRFPNRPVHLPEGLRWDILGRYRGVLDGLRAAVPVDSLGIDSWAVDYGLLDADGPLLGNPVHYRDRRTEGVPEKVWATVPPEELYRETGIQYAPFNTLYQLVAARAAPPNSPPAKGCYLSRTC